MWKQKPCFRFEIDNFSQKIKTKNNSSGQKPFIESEIFKSGGFEWSLVVYPKGDSYCDDHMSIYLLQVGNFNTISYGWKGSARVYFVMRNQSDKELFRSHVAGNSLFSAETYSGCHQAETLPLSKFEEKGFLENDKLIIEVYINVDDVSKNEEIVDVNGFRVFASQASSVEMIFAEHPEFAKDFKPKNKVVKTEYMNVLLNLIDILKIHPNKLWRIKRKKACSDMTELIDAGFNLDWLKPKLGLEVSSERKKASDLDMSPVQQLEERVKNLELESSFKMDSLKSLEKNYLKANTDWSRVQKLEDSVMHLESTSVSSHYLNERLKDNNAKSRESYSSVSSQVKQLKDTVKDLELMVSNLTAELDKKKAKSSIDDFLLVDNVD